jgi:hypothetical protein
MNKMNKRTRNEDDITDIDNTSTKRIIVAVGKHRHEIESFEDITPDLKENILKDLQIIIDKVDSQRMKERSKVINFKNSIVDVLNESGDIIKKDNQKIQQLAEKIRLFLEQTKYDDDGYMILDSDFEDSPDYVERITKPKMIRRQLAAAVGGKYIRKKSSKKKKYTKKLKKHKKKTIKKRKSKKIKSKKRR